MQISAGGQVDGGSVAPYVAGESPATEIDQVERPGIGRPAGGIGAIDQYEVALLEVGLHLGVAGQAEDGGVGKAVAEFVGERMGTVVVLCRKAPVGAQGVLDDGDSRVAAGGVSRQEIPHTEAAAAQDLVRQFRGKFAHAFQGIMKVRLGNSADFSQAALGNFAVADAFPQYVDKIILQFSK